MKAVLGRFSVWSSGHLGAPCPAAADLGGDAGDAWGHPFVLTCTGQPEDQIVGLISAGPDGVNGNADDVASWQLGHDVTDLVRGSRWATASVVPAPVVAPPVPTRPTPLRRTDAAKSKSAPVPSPAKPKPRKGVRFDENGIPIDR